MYNLKSSQASPTSDRRSPVSLPNVPDSRRPRPVGPFGVEMKRSLQGQFLARWLRRPLTWAVLVPVLLAGVSLASSTRKKDHPLDPWNADVAPADADPDRRFLAELTVLDSDVLRRIAVKNQIAADLVHDRITFPQAVASYRQILAGTPVILEQLRENYPGATEEECIGRSVISFAAGALYRAPETVQTAVLRRLEGELQAHLAANAPAKKLPQVR